MVREVSRESVINTEDIYIGYRKSTVTKWVDLILIFKLFLREPRFEGGRPIRKRWWRKEATNESLRAMLVLREARIR